MTTTTMVPPGFFLSVTEDGKKLRYPLFSHVSDWSRGVTTASPGSNLDITLNYTIGGPIQLDFLKTRSPPPYNYAFFDLLNKKISFTVDVSRVPKDYNFAFYTSALTAGDTYKDAQSVDSRTEIDLMEANSIAYHFTTHKKFDKGGNLTMGLGGVLQHSPTSSSSSSTTTSRKFTSATSLPPEQLYGIGKYIDTRSPFHVQVSITTKNIKLVLEQHNKHIWQEIIGGSYLESLVPEIRGRRHVLICSLWYGSMDWLSGGLVVPDETEIRKNVNATISNIAITTLGT